MTPEFAAKFSFFICLIDIGIWKIDGSVLKIYGMVIAEYSM